MSPVHINKDVPIYGPSILDQRSSNIITPAHEAKESISGL